MELRTFFNFSSTTAALLICVSTQSLYATFPILPTFDNAMICHPNDVKYVTPLFKRGHAAEPVMSFLKEQYTYFCQSIGTQSCVMGIPKIIHQIWIGPDSFPKKCKDWQKSWLHHHPDWEYILWTNEEVAQLEMHNRAFFEQETNWGAKSDIARYEILHQFGGVYVDVDFKCLHPFDWIHESCDFYASFFEPARLKNTGRLANGIIGCAPGHPLTGHLIDEVKNYRHEGDLIKRVGPNFFSAVIKRYIQNCPGVNIVFPSNFFFSWHKRQVLVKPETMAIHYYTATWSKKSS